MPHTERNPRFGAHLYEVRVSPPVEPRGVVYVNADSITVTPAGALILAAEVPPLEDEEDEPPSGIENPPAFIVAPGLWQCVTQVTDAEDGHRPFFFEGGFLDTDDTDDTDDTGDTGDTDE